MYRVAKTLQYANLTLDKTSPERLSSLLKFINSLLIVWNSP